MTTPPTNGEWLRLEYHDYDLVLLVLAEPSSPNQGPLVHATIPALASIENCERTWDLMPRSYKAELARAGYNREAFGAALLAHFLRTPNPDGGPVLVALMCSPGAFSLESLGAEPGEEGVTTPLFRANFVIVVTTAGQSEAKAWLSVPPTGNLDVWRHLPAPLQLALSAAGWSQEDFDADVRRWFDDAQSREVTPGSVPSLRVDLGRQSASG